MPAICKRLSCVVCSSRGVLGRLCLPRPLELAREWCSALPGVTTVPSRSGRPCSSTPGVFRGSGLLRANLESCTNLVSPRDTPPHLSTHIMQCSHACHGGVMRLGCRNHCTTMRRILPIHVPTPTFSTTPGEGANSGTCGKGIGKGTPLSDIVLVGPLAGPIVPKPATKGRSGKFGTSTNWAMCGETSGLVGGGGHDHYPLVHPLFHFCFHVPPQLGL